MTIELNDEEAQGLISLLDTATKAGGLNAAFLAVPLFHKIKAAADAPAEPLNIEAEAE